MKKVEVIEKKRVFDGFFKIDEALVRYELFGGGMSEPTKRLNFERGDAVAALLWNRESEKILLTHQFRYPTWEKDAGWLVEIVAGILEKGEDPEEAMKREILEETGYRAERLERLHTFFLSPGGSSERIFLFYGEVKDSDRIARGGGLESEQEDIQVLEYSLPEISTALAQGAIMDAKTLIALQWFMNTQGGEKGRE